MNRVAEENGGNEARIAKLRTVDGATRWDEDIRKQSLQLFLCYKYEMICSKVIKLAFIWLIMV